MSQNKQQTKKPFEPDQLQQIAQGKADPLPSDNDWQGYSFYQHETKESKSNNSGSLRLGDLVWALDNLG